MNGPALNGRETNQESEGDAGLLPGARKAEDTSEGCHALAAADRARSDANVNDRMKQVFEHSAQMWDKRARMIEKFEAQRAKAGGAPDDKEDA